MTAEHAGGLPLSKDDLLNVYRKMRTIRGFKERLHVDFGRGDIPGFMHLYVGEEAAGVGIMSHLNDGDRSASTHRRHGHCIAKGVDPVEMMKEIYGKKGGSCNGKGSSMHIADLSKGMMGANGILGAGTPLICGAVLTAKFRGKGEVSITFAGGGAANQGTFLESLNLAVVWNLPVIFVIENNGYAESTARDYGTAVDSYVDRAAGFGISGVTVDGTDFFAVYEAAGEVIRRARRRRTVAARMQDDPLLWPLRRRCADLSRAGRTAGRTGRYPLEQGLPEEVRRCRDAGQRDLTGRARHDRQGSRRADRPRRGRGEGSAAAERGRLAH